MHEPLKYCYLPCLLVLSECLVTVALVGAEVELSPTREREQEAESSQVEEEEVSTTESEFAAQIDVTATLPEISSITFPGEDISLAPQQDLVESTRDHLGFTAFRRASINLDPNIRGLQESELTVVVNGTRTFAAGPGRMDSDMSHVSPHAVEKLEVVKGPYALTWGAGAMAAIRVETIRPEFGSPGGLVQGRAGVRYGDNASRSDLFGGLWGSTDTIRFEVLANGRSGDDYKAGGGEMVPGNYDSYEGRTGFGYRPNDRWSFQASAGYQRQEDIDFPGRLLDATFFKTKSLALEGNWTPSSGFFDEVFGQVYVNDKEHLMNNNDKPTAQADPDRVPPFPIEVDLPAESNTFGGRFSGAGAVDGWQWKTGGDFYHLEQSASRSISNRQTGGVLFEDIVWPEAEIDDLGLYAQGIRTLTNMSLGGTLRVDFVDTAAGTVSEFFESQISAPLDTSETNWSAAMSGSSLVGSRVRLNYGLGRAVRTASALERYSDRFPATKFQSAAEFLGNPGLSPETSNQLDFGAEYATSTVTLGAALFYRVIDDYITVLPDPSVPKRLPLSPPIVYRFINGDEATFSGGEAWARSRFGDWFHFDGSLSYVRGEDREFDEPAFGLPPLTGRIGIRCVQPSGRYWVEFSTLIADDQSRVAASRFERPTPGYAVYDLIGSLSLADQWQIRLGIENLTDKLYSNHLNALNPFRMERIPEIGRNVFAAVEYRF